MATALNTNTTYLQILERAKQEFQKQNSHIPEHQRHQLWLQVASGLSNNGVTTSSPDALARQVPRSMSCYDTSKIDLNSMDRTLSAPATAPVPNDHDGDFFRRSLSNMSSWQHPIEDQASSYILHSAASSRKPTPLQTINEVSMFSSSGMVEYDPEEYINTLNSEPLGSYPFNFPQHHDSNYLNIPLTQDSQWSPSLDGSISPSTPPTALMTPGTTISSSTMSRDGSINPLIYDDNNAMFRVQSDSSSIFPPLLNDEDGSRISYSLDVDRKPIGACADTSLFPLFTGPSSGVFPCPTSMEPSTSSLGSSSHDESYLAEDMRRSTSTSSESDSSQGSTSSTVSRQSRRDQEIKAQAERKIAPAPRADESSDETMSASSNVQMKRVTSEDGSSRDVAPITKAPYTRPHHPKIMCQHCNARPEGFRGTHELDRHVQRAHAELRKGYICVEPPTHKKFLAGCKHCRNGKVYGAYYNAAAHLRRAHFHPRKRGRKGKGDERRGGIGGGDDPPMEYLKKDWIKEVEVNDKVKHVKQALVTERASVPVPAPAALPMPEKIKTDDTCINTNSHPQLLNSGNMTAPYPPQPTNDMLNMIAFNHCIDTSMFDNAADAPFSAISPNTVPHNTLSNYGNFNFAQSSTNDLNSWDFDAYRTQ
ncbi:hypothetical protein K491DRAFT_616655 [Lophiostoma macrostomum CBS 122681]|uniref:DUF7896 domain-containing protein n=1 Tax=Lophiostoma macrostomum CBS 122681 TaxID=1314788 RepID=A0A6A6TVM7_9PLEO|nr:hypothetical protein K491DRAFT_616655 [Lophiostoma macrostomum CBS 122681]